MSDPRRRQPLERLPASQAAPAATPVTMCEVPLRSYVNVRGDPADRAFAAAVASVVGFQPPRTPDSVAGDPTRAILWLGPDEWLIAAVPDAQVDVASDISRALAGAHVAVTDLSAGYTTVRLRGSRTRDVLAKGCSLDLHPSAFGPNRCAQTNVGKAAAIVWAIDERPTFDLIVRRSFAEYLARWLLEADDEYGLLFAGAEPSEPDWERLD